MNTRALYLTTAFLLSGLLEAGENLFYNSSFELGTAGWDQGKLKVKYPCESEIPPVREWIETKDAPFGKHVMQITMDRNLSDTWLLSSPDIKLVPGKKYTLSFYVKPEKKSKITYSMHSNHYDVWHCAASDSRVLEGGKWQRVHKTFVYKRKNKNHDEGYDHFFMLFLAPYNGLSYQFDGMQLEEGELTDYKPAADVEYKLTTPELYLKETSEITVDFSAYSYNGKQNPAKELILTDTGKKQELKKQNVGFDLVPGEIQTRKITFDNLPYGGLRIHAPGTAKAAAVDFVRIHANDLEYKSGKYALGIGTKALGLFEAGYLRTDKINLWKNKYTIDEGNAVRLSGSVAVFNFDASAWSFGSLMPNKRGEYNWKYHDLFYARLRQLKLKAIEGLVSQVLMTKMRKRDMGKWVPDWLRQLDINGHPEGLCNGNWKHIRTILPPPEIIAECSAAIAERYQDDICMFRLFAESNGYMKARQLFEYAKATYPAVRKVAPNLLINAFNASEDFGSSMDGFFADFLKFGGGKYTDAVSFHPYKSSQDDSAFTAMDGIQSFKNVMKKYEVDLKLAETECFYLVPHPYDNQPEYTWMLFEPEAITRRCLIDMGEGLFLSIPLELRHLHQAWAGNQDNSYGHFVKVPNARFAAHNAAGYFLNGAEKNGKVKLPGTELCYTFEKDGKKFSAIWCISGSSVMTLNLPDGVGCKAYDLYGNLEKSASKTLELVLDRRPKFIEWSGDADVKAIHTAGDYTPLQLIQFHGVQQMDGGIGLMVSNRSSKPVSGIAKLNSAYLKSPKTKFSDLKPNSTACILIPAEFKENAPKSFQLTAVCMINGKFLFQKVDLKQNPVLRLGQENQLGPHRFKLEKQGNKLFFTGFLNSKTPKKAADPKTPWDGDSIEIFCDYAPETFNPNKPEVLNDSCIQFCIPALESGSPVPWTSRKKKNVEITDIKVVRTDDGAQVTAALPYRKGMHINFHFNAEGKTAILNGKKNFRDRSGYAVISE